MNYNKQFNPFGTAFSMFFEHQWFEVKFEQDYSKLKGDQKFNSDYYEKSIYEISRNNRASMYKHNFISPPLVSTEENETPHGKILFDLFNNLSPISLSAYVEILSGALLPTEELLSETNFDETRKNFINIFSDLDFEDFKRFSETNMFLTLGKNYSNHKRYFPAIINGFQKEIPLKEAKNTENYDNRLRNISLKEYILDIYQGQFK